MKNNDLLSEEKYVEKNVELMIMNYKYPTI